MNSTEFKPGRMYVPDNKAYSDIMKPNADVVRNFEDVIMYYAEKACNSLVDAKNILIADYCSADGQTEVPLLRRLIRQIQEKNTKTEITVVFEDNQGNDYNALFGKVLKDDVLSTSGVYVMASATSMYEQCLPSCSAQFIFSFSGLYNLSRRPCLMKSSIFSMRSDPDEKLLFKKQAESDWNLFLSKRSNELKPGGYMFIIPSVLEQDLVYIQLNTILRSLVKENMISEAEFVNIGHNTYLRSEDDLKKPFEENAEEVKELNLVSIEIVNHTIFDVGNEPLGPERASVIAEITKTWACQTIIDHLDDDRSYSDKRNIGEEVFKRLFEIYKDLAVDYYYLMPRLVIQKRMAEA